ncbi:MAG: tetraacyldisaccharide 4'-kinase [Bryobacterales bacterium]|nr:tetraacyldisaccharide 4'-kinase [Bryobacterales bacterium]
MLIYFLYRLLGVLALPLILVYLLRRGLRDRRYWQGMGERFGQAPPGAKQPTLPGGIWLHAVSVGEVATAVELIRQLRAASPQQAVHVSVTTVAGRQLAESKLQGLADSIFYLPFDYVWMLRRVLRRLRPRVVLIMETEIWPNLFREAKRFGAGLVVVNGRISDRAFPRYQEFRWFFAPVLVWPDRILVQNEIARERYVALGAPAERVMMAGNLKYDLQVKSLQVPGDIADWIRGLEPRRCWIAASTMPPAGTGDVDEDAVVIQAIGELQREEPGLLTILVPRRPERFDSAAQKLQAAGIACVRRSQLKAAALPCVLLLDSVGELVSLFPLSDCVFMGGTLAERGGHNILEPAFYGKPVIIGPHMENFPDIAEEFRAAEAVTEIGAGAELALAVRFLLTDAKARARIGERARRLAEAKRGATARAVQAVQQVAGDCLPYYLRPWPVRMAAAMLGQMWLTGVRLDRAVKERGQGRLPAPVISVGGLAAGGTGKTPVAAYLAEQFAKAGRKPAILTRGYGRQDPAPLLLVPGEQAPVSQTGEEAQILLRAGHAAVAVGADRASLGRRAFEKFYPDVFLLDDGFQHWRLARDLDLVLLDALDPFAGDALLPVGRLREPVAALWRAHVILVTRSATLQPWPALEARIRRVNRTAPIFYSRVKPVEWVDAHEKREALPEGPALAFCGLGNPASFWATLAEMQVATPIRRAFPDHHHYTEADLHALAGEARRAGCRVLLTTEKDFLNLPATCGDLTVYWLRTTIEIDRERAFLDAMRAGAGTAPGTMGRPVY